MTTLLHSGSPTGGFVLEDLSVGQRFRSQQQDDVTAAEIIAFAECFDEHRSHTHPELATPPFFEGLTASGWHTAAIAMKLILAGGRPELASGAIGLGSELAWAQPVCPVTSFTCKAKLSKSPHHDQSRIG